MTHSQNDNQTTLSAQGTHRRDVIRDAACKAVADRRRGARFVKIGTAGAVSLVLVAAVWSQFPTRGGLVPTGDGPLTQGNSDAGASEGGVRLIEVVQDDGTPVYTNLRYVKIIDQPAVAVNKISDDELLDLLAQAGRPSGLIRIGDRVMVVEHAQIARRDAGQSGAS